MHRVPTIFLALVAVLTTYHAHAQSNPTYIQFSPTPVKGASNLAETGVDEGRAGSFVFTPYGCGFSTGGGHTGDYQCMEEFRDWTRAPMFKETYDKTKHTFSVQFVSFFARQFV